MNKLVRFILPVVLACGVATVVLPGCGGGSGGLITSISDYQGNYAGEFTGTVQQGVPGAGSAVSGTFTATAKTDGTVTGTITQLGVGTFAASGTIDRNGNVILTAKPGEGEVSTLSGKVTNKDTGALSGDFTTTSGGATVVKGTFEGRFTAQ